MAWQDIYIGGTTQAHGHKHYISPRAVATALQREKRHGHIKGFHLDPMNPRPAGTGIGYWKGEREKTYRYDVNKYTPQAQKHLRKRLGQEEIMVERESMDKRGRVHENFALPALHEKTDKYLIVTFPNSPQNSKHNVYAFLHALTQTPGCEGGNVQQIQGGAVFTSAMFHPSREPAVRSAIERLAEKYGVRVHAEFR